MKITLISIIFLLFLTTFSMAQPASSSINWLSRHEADTLYAPIGFSDPAETDFYFYFDSSYNTKIYWNFSKGDKTEIYITLAPGKKYILGDQIT